MLPPLGPLAKIEDHPPRGGESDIGHDIWKDILAIITKGATR